GEYGECDHCPQAPAGEVMDSTSVGYQACQAIRLEMTAYPRNLLDDSSPHWWKSRPHRHEGAFNDERFAHESCHPGHRRRTPMVEGGRQRPCRDLDGDR